MNETLKQRGQILIGIGIMVIGLYVGYFGWAGLYEQSRLGAVIVWFIIAVICTIGGVVICAIGYAIMFGD